MLLKRYESTEVDRRQRGSPRCLRSTSVDSYNTNAFLHRNISTCK